MPIIERKSRTRLRSRGEIDIKNAEQLRTVLAASHGDEDAWREVRARVVRYLLPKAKSTYHAERIADSCHRRPDLMAMRSPEEYRAWKRGICKV